MLSKCTCFPTAEYVVIVFLLLFPETVQSANNLRIEGNTFVGESFRLVCSTELAATGASLAKFYRSLDSGSVGELVAGIVYFRDDNNCEDRTPSGSAVYSYECISNGSEFYIEIPADNLTEHNTYWRCTTGTDPTSLDNNQIHITIGVSVTQVTIINPVPDGKGIIRIRRNKTIVFHCRTTPSRPLANISWYIGDTLWTGGTSNTTTNPDGLIVTNGYLTYTADLNDQGKSVDCSAQNHNGTEPVRLVSKPILSVLHGPNDTIEVSPELYVVDEGSRTEPIACTAACNPACSYSWFQGNSLKSNTSLLDLGFAETVEAGTYVCEAYTFIDSERLASRRSIQVIVNYQPTITTITGSGIFQISSAAVLTCSVDSVPDPNITWYKQRENKMLKSSTTKNSTLTLNNLQCSQMTNYICVAENTLGKQEGRVQVLIKCPPLVAGKQETKTSESRGSNVTLSIHTISFQFPRFVWKTPDDAIIVPDGQNYTQSDEGPSSTLTIQNIQLFGNYSVIASNGIKPDPVFEFMVKEEQEGEVGQVPGTTGITIGMLIGITIVGFVAGLVLMLLVWRYKDNMRKSKCCKDRLYMKAEAQTEEHTYSEVSGQQGIELVQPTEQPALAPSSRQSTAPTDSRDQQYDDAMSSAHQAYENAGQQI